MVYANITGWGKCVPPAVLTNDDLATIIDTSDEWIQSRTGIRERRITHVGLSELATVAARQAIACAGIEACDIDLVILATASGDELIPNTASRVQFNIGAHNAAAFDLNAACTGFLYGLNTATSMIQSGAHKRALVIGADRLTYYMDWTNRNVCVLFGDGAGAVVVEASDTVSGVIGYKMGCDSEARDILAVTRLGTTVDRFSTSAGYYPVSFQGQEIFKRAVNGMSRASNTALGIAKTDKESIDVIVPHQANMRIIQTLAKKMKVPMEKVKVNVDKYGNTSAASVPIALTEALDEGMVKPGNKILSAAFGAGLTWAAAVIQWGERVTPINRDDSQLPACNKTALELIKNSVEACQRLSSGD